MILWISLLLVLLRQAQTEENIKIGFLLDSNVQEAKKVIEYAIDRSNKEILKDEEFVLSSEIAEVTLGNEFQASVSVCNLLQSGVSAVFGPESKSSSVIVADICDSLEMPFIDARHDMELRLPAINLHPNPSVIAEVLVNLVNKFEWASFMILFENGEFLPRMAELLKTSVSNGPAITARRIDLGLSPKNFRSVLRSVKLSKETRIIIECSTDQLEEILKQTQQVGLMTDQHHFILTNFDAHTIDMEPFQYSGTRITTLRIIDPKNPIPDDIARYFTEAAKAEESGDGESAVAEKSEDDNEDGEDKENNEEDDGENGEEDEKDKEDGKEEAATEKPAEEETEVFDPTKIRTKNALILDGILLLAKTFKELGLTYVQSGELECTLNATAWANGISITNFMRSADVDGITGNIKLDMDGTRSAFSIFFFDLIYYGFVPLGTWDSESDISINEYPHPTANGIDTHSVFNKTFIVLTVINEPYGMLKDSAAELHGNERFEGFGIDIIHELSLMLGFKYEFRLQADGAYGGINAKTGEWTGMIRELQEGRADLAITDLTITAERETGADFTNPFMTLGISILYRKPSKQPPSTFSFMSPFSMDVWIALGAAYFTVSLFLFILGRVAPSEWDNPYPCIEEPTELENQFSFNNSMWFCIGALLQQGSEIAPKAPSTRIVAAIYWFFTLIMVSSYTANLAAFLTVESLYSPLKSVEDLKDCGTPDGDCPVTFGAKKTGSTLNFFKESDYKTYQNMYTYMSQNPEMLVTDNKIAIQKAETENYAYLMESSSIEYIIERHCDLTQVGQPLDEKGYGIAMKKNSEHRNALSEGVIRLQESGKLAALKLKWWKEKKGGGSCQDDGGDEGALALEMANVEGVFYVLIAGFFVSILLALINVLFEARSRYKENKKKNVDEATALGMENVIGVFYVLFGGVFVGALIGIIQSIINCLIRSHKQKVPFMKEFVDEMTFILKCESDVKVVKPSRSQSNDSRKSDFSLETPKSARHSNDDKISSRRASQESL